MKTLLVFALLALGWGQAFSQENQKVAKPATSQEINNFFSARYDEAASPYYGDFKEWRIEKGKRAWTVSLTVFPASSPWRYKIQLTQAKKGIIIGGMQFYANSLDGSWYHGNWNNTGEEPEFRKNLKKFK